MRERFVAVLRGVHACARPAETAVVSPVRPPVSLGRRSLRRLPPAAHHVGAFGLRVPGSREGRGPSAQVLRVAWGRGCARLRPRRARPAARRRRVVGTARPRAAGRARLRPGRRSGASARAGARPPCASLRSEDEGNGSTVPPQPGGAAARDGGRLRAHPRHTGAGAPPARRRRPDHGCDRFLLRRSPRRGGSTRDPPAHGVPLVHRPAARTSRLASTLSPCLYSGGAPVRVCGCPGINPGSRCQPRAKRPT